MEIHELTYAAVCIRIFAAILIGGLLGIERGMKNRAAGMRTYMLVCLGACVVMLTNQYIYQALGTGDPVRMGAQVVSGIGFLGAGTIVVTRRSHIKGLTTAAGLWTSAAVGLALGIGFYEAAVMGAVAVFFIMTIMQGLDARLHRKAKSLEIYFELRQDVSLSAFLRAVEERDMGVRDIQRENEQGAYIATLKTGKRRNLTELSEEARELPGVTFLECL